MGVTPTDMMAKAIADDDEIPQGHLVEGGEERTQSGFPRAHKNSSGNYKN